MKRILTVTAKCSDLCATRFTDENGKETESDSYVPENIGIGGGDYIELEIDVETGMIINFPKHLSNAKIVKEIEKA